MDLTHRVHGWGYQGREVADLVQFAHDVRATVVVDVRLTPISRRHGFSKRRLAEALANEGLCYVHLPALGNPRDNRAGFADPGSPAGSVAHKRFRTEVLGNPEASGALQELARLADSTHVVVLCFEADQSMCHRDLVINELRHRRELVLA